MWNKITAATPAEIEENVGSIVNDRATEQILRKVETLNVNLPHPLVTVGRDMILEVANMNKTVSYKLYVLCNVYIYQITS